MGVIPFGRTVISFVMVLSMILSIIFGSGQDFGSSFFCVALLSTNGCAELVVVMTVYGIGGGVALFPSCALIPMGIRNDVNRRP